MKLSHTMKTSHIRVSTYLLKRAGLLKGLAKGVSALGKGVRTGVRAKAVPNIAPAAADLAKIDTSRKGLLKADIADNLGAPKPKVDVAKVRQELAAQQPHLDGAVDLSGVSRLPPLAKPKPAAPLPPTAWGQSKLPDTISHPKAVQGLKRDYFEDMRPLPGWRPDYEPPALNSVWYGKHPAAAPDYMPIKSGGAAPAAVPQPGTIGNSPPAAPPTPFKHVPLGVVSPPPTAADWAQSSAPKPVRATAALTRSGQPAPAGWTKPAVPTPVPNFGDVAARNGLNRDGSAPLLSVLADTNAHVAQGVTQINPLNRINPLKRKSLIGGALRDWAQRADAANAANLPKP